MSKDLGSLTDADGSPHPNEPSPTSVGATLIAARDGVGFWLIGGEVYRASDTAQRDTMGVPMGARWECSLAHFNRYRQVICPE